MTLAIREDVQQQNEGNTQLAGRRYEPKAAVGDARGLKSLLEASKVSIMQALPRHITPERLIKTMLVAANRTPALFNCTQSSVLETINRAAELGLDLSGTLGEAYPIPFGNVCTLIIGYRGLEKLAWQSGEISSIDAEVVYERDEFKFRKGTEVTVEWSPYLKGDRGEVVGAYACVTMKSGGKLARFLPVSEIEKVRAASRSGKSGPWVQWWDEMARKTALRRVLKDAPLSTEKFTTAMETDAEDASRFDDVIEAETARPRGAAALMNKVRGNAPAGPDGQPIQVSEPIEDPAEAEEILRKKSPSQTPPPGETTAAPASAGAGPSDTDDHIQEQGAAGREETQEPAEVTPREKFQNWKDAIFAALKKNGFTTVQASNAWTNLMVKAGTKGAANEIKYPDADRATALEAAVEAAGVFAKPE